MLPTKKIRKTRKKTRRYGSHRIAAKSPPPVFLALAKLYMFDIQYFRIPCMFLVSLWFNRGGIRGLLVLEVLKTVWADKGGNFEEKTYR